MDRKENENKEIIPSIKEIESLYRENLRIEASKIDDLDLLEDKSNKSVFEKFRRVTNADCKELSLSKVESKYLKKYTRFVEDEKYLKKIEIERLENLIEFEKFFLRYERRINKEKNKSRHYGTNSATRYRTDKIKYLEEELSEILLTSKEAWEFYYERELLKDIDNQKKQALVDVKYVKESKEKIIESLNLGVPVYLVGHLGSGKTQLATECAIEFTIQNKIQNELEVELEKWFIDNENASEEDLIEEFIRLNNTRKDYYENILLSGDEKQIESLQPLFISGSHNLTYEDMFVEKTLSLSHSFSEGSYSDYLNMLIGDFYDWMQEHEEKLNQMTEEEQLQLKIQIWKSFSDLLVASNSAFGTEIKKIEREILIAVKEGRTVIIDELNTIAMQNLIGLNDILQRHAGTTAYITGVGPVMIKPGFGFIGTGNLSTQMVSYEGTNELNPAFKSRFFTMEYNYVPQKLVENVFQQENPEDNQLFRIIIGQLADDNGNLQIPNSKKTLDELFRFAQLSKLTQNIFMGKWKDNESTDENNIDEPELRESVLSIRNILHVLDNWNLGEEKDLSKALWDGFISSITYPDDQNYIIAQAVRFGFFSKEDGWDVRTKGVGESTTTYDEIRKKEYDYIREPIEVLSSLDLIYLIFGNEKETNSNKLLELFAKEDEISSNIDIDKYKELNEALLEIEHSKDLLDYIESFGDKNES